MILQKITLSCCIVLCFILTGCTYNTNENNQPSKDTDDNTEILILGSNHITSTTPNEYLEYTIDKLIEWKPDAVVVELLPGELIHLYQDMGNEYSSIPVGGMAQAKAILKLTKPHINLTFLEAKAILEQENTTPEKKVMAYLATYEPINALLHWNSNLDLPKEIHSIMEKYAKSSSESHRIALPIAKHLQHNKLYHFDDHTGLDIYYKYEKELDDYWASEEFQNTQKNKRLDELLSNANSKTEHSKNYWEFLKMLNSDEYIQLNYEMETEPYLKHNLPNNANRARIAQWDGRNLFMSARLRLISALYPKGKILVIVGASHKGPIENIIRESSADIDIIGLSHFDENKNH